MVASYLLLYKVPKTIKKEKLVPNYSFKSMVSCLYWFLACIKARLPWWKGLVEESHSPRGRQEAERGRGQDKIAFQHVFQVTCILQLASSSRVSTTSQQHHLLGAKHTWGQARAKLEPPPITPMWRFLHGPKLSRSFGQQQGTCLPDPMIGISSCFWPPQWLNHVTSPLVTTELSLARPRCIW